RTGFARARNLFGSVDFDERIHAEFVLCETQKARERFVVERGDDQQQRVGARRGGLIDLILVEEEVFPQDWQTCAPLHFREVSERAAEVVFLRQNRYRRRAASLVCARRLARRRADANLSLRRRRALELRDDVHAFAFFKRRAEGVRPRLRPDGERLASHLFGRARGLRLGQTLPFLFDDSREKVARHPLAPRRARELFELGERRAFVNAPLSEARGLTYIVGESADEERRRRVRKDE